MNRATVTCLMPNMAIESFSFSKICSFG